MFVIDIHTFYNVIKSTNLSDCIVTNGKDAGSACIFPFIFNGEEYNGCILETNSDEVSFEIKSWCSTEVSPVIDRTLTV